MVPREGNTNFAEILEKYIDSIKQELNVFTGRMFYTGTHKCFINSPMGKNTISQIPKEVANLLGKDNSDGFSFHSLRRSSATAAADNGATVAQMMDFYGWAQPSMPQEYILSSKHAVQGMAVKLQGSGIRWSR